MKNDDDYKLHEFVAHSTNVNCLTFGPQSAQVVATGGEDCKVNIWRVDNTANIWSLGQNKSPIECLCFDAEEQYLVSGAMNGSLKVFDLNEGKLARSLRGHQTTVTSIHYHPYGEFVVSGSVDNTMKVWDVRSKACIQTFMGHEKEVTCVRFSPDGRWVASSGKDGQFLVWDLVAGKLIQAIKTKSNYLTSFEFNPSEFVLAGASSDRTVKFWDLETFERIGRTPPDTSPVSAVTFSEGGESLCAGSNNSLRVWGWDPAIEAKLTLPMGWDKVYEMRVAPNTNTLVGGSFMSNFVSIFSVDLDDILNISHDMNDNDPDGEDSVVDESKPVFNDETPEKKNLNDSLAKEVPDENDSGDDKLSDDYENDFEDDMKLDLNDLQQDVDSKGSSGPSVEWDSGITPRDLATSMGESFLAKMKEDERKARKQDGQGPPVTRPPSTAQRHRNPPKRPDSQASRAKADSKSDRRPGTNGSVQKPASSHYSGVDGSNNPGLEGLEIVGSKHAPRESSGGTSSASVGSGSNIGPGGYRYSSEPPDDYNRHEVRSSGRGAERESRVDKERASVERRGVSPRVKTPSESKQEPPPPQANYLKPTESSAAAKDKDTEEMLDRLVSQSGEIMSSLSQRLTNLRLLNQYWERGDMTVIIEHLKTILLTSQHDPHGCVVLADFFSSVDLKASHIVTLEVCGKLLPLLDDMLSMGSVAEEVSLAGLVAVVALAEAYGPLITDTRGVVGRHVDISREERMERCNVCHRTFSVILDRCDGLKQRHRNNSLFKGVIEKAQSLLLSIV
mmetsp:Transcript_1797/g.3395  ORF Transcript_1797/g.3395 Transcript_1797/m.3395 type:complete len:787 (+) Transcript_1797:135-2495(+)